MILIADSGATSTHWAALAGGAVTHYATPGMNPMTTPDGELSHSLLLLAQACRQQPAQLVFYGAGCGNAAAAARLRQLLGATFPQASIAMETDLMAACRAACGSQTGRVGILGTGSNACCYDGTRLWQSHPSLGYLLGDEGSGNHLGRLLLQGYLNGRMPQALKAMFYDDYHLDYAHIMERLYRQPNVNRFMAGFVPFLARHQEEEYVQALLRRAFGAFYVAQLQPLRQEQLPLYLVGGVAYEFRDMLRQLCRQRAIPLSAIVQDPLEGLVRYHQQAAADA